MKAPKLVAEKPSFSRGPDGRTPFGVPAYREKMEELRRETLQFTTRQEYMTAETSCKEIDVVKQQEKAYKLAAEASRQRDERTKLEKAFKIEKSHLASEWVKKLEDVEEECKRRQAILEEKHQIQHADLEKEVAVRIAKMRFKKSIHLLQLEDTEKRLANQRDFRQATEVMSRADRQRKLEEADFARRRELAERKPFQELAVRHEEEMRNLLQKCHGMRITVRRERDAAFEVFKQKYRNLEADLTHAHAVEYTLPAEIGEVQTHKSRSTTASTFRGTLKYEALAGTKFDVADVSRLAEC